MRRLLFLPLLATLVGCGSGTSYVHSDTTTLGRVVVYRNGVAYYERYAKVNDDTLKLAVPADKVDDFLKSLTVVDAKTGKPAPVAYPTDVPRSSSGLIDMKINLLGASPHEVKLSYVTESPAWKPSYRIVLGDKGKAHLQAWAVVDNTSGEDWNNVRLGVGSSSAMSFRFDLRSLRVVQRETLHANDLFALAPPTGDSTYGNGPRDEKKVLGDFSDDALAVAEAPPPPPMPASVASRAGGGGRAYAPAKPAQAEGAPGAFGGVGKGASLAPSSNAPEPLAQVARRLNGNGNRVVVEGYADAKDQDKKSASLERANKVREQLVRYGVDPNRVVAVGRGDESGRAGGVRVLEAPPDTEQPADSQAKADTGAAPSAPEDPIGTSHFESGIATSVPRGTSAMISILDASTEGEAVYLYDPESARGNRAFAFRAVHVRNPTDSVLESGPVTVFGDGRFIGEGLSEPIPARSGAFIPFALDRQIVVEPKQDERDEIARILTVQRGVFSSEVRHARRLTWVLHNRLGERATVYIRHTVATGYTLSPKSPASAERFGASHLFRVDLEPGAKKEIVVEEQTPVFRTIDVRNPGGIELVRAFLSADTMAGPLGKKVGELIQLQQEIGNLEQRITTTREQMQEYRDRMDELHAQIVTLRAVRTAGPLMQSLERKMQDVSDRLSKATIDVVNVQEKLMVARIHFQDGVADLSLDDAPVKPGALEPSKKAK